MRLSIRYRLLRVICLAICGCSFAAVAADSVKTLKNNRWELVSFPIGISTQPFAELPGGAFSVDEYGTSWAIFTYAFGKYELVSLADSPEPGRGYWIIQASGVDVQMTVATDNASNALTVTGDPCLSLEGCVEAVPAVEPDAGGWSMLGTSMPGYTRLDDVSVTNGAVGELCNAGCALEQAAQGGVVADSVFTYDSAVQSYVLRDSASYVTAWQGFWFYTYEGALDHSVYLPVEMQSDVCSPNMVAQSEASLNTAIDCYNVSGFDVKVILASDIASSGPFTKIESDPAHHLSVEGNGFSIVVGAFDDYQLEIVSGDVLIDNVVLQGHSADSTLLVKNSAALEITRTELSNSNVALANAVSSAESTVYDSIFADNTTGVQQDGGVVNLSNSTVDGSHGAGIVAEAGTMEIFNSTVSDSFLSGVYVNGASVTVASSTISNNRAAAVNSNSGNTLIHNSTLSGNRNGLSGYGGNVSVGNSSLVYNAADGIRIRGTSVALFSSLVANNGQSGPYGNCIQFNGSIKFVGPARSSFSSDGTCRQFSVGSALSTVRLPANYEPPLDLDPLQDNACTLSSRTKEGRACTGTHALVLTSVASNSGECGGWTRITPKIPTANEDQRGFARQGTCDSGAYEND